VTDIAAIIYIACAFILGAAIGFVGGLAGYVTKRGENKKSNDIR